MKSKKIKTKEIFEGIQDKIQDLENDYSIDKDVIKNLQKDIECVNKDYNILRKKYNQLANYAMAIIIVFVTSFMYFDYSFEKRIERITEGYGFSRFDSIKRTILPISNKLDSVTKKEYQVISYETTKGGNIVTYTDLIEERDSIKKTLRSELDTIQMNVNRLTLELENKDAVLELMKNYYKVDYSITKTKSVRTMKVFSPKIDSTFILYDIFKHRLFFDEDTKHWYIKKEPGASERVIYVKSKKDY